MRHVGAAAGAQPVRRGSTERHKCLRTEIVAAVSDRRRRSEIDATSFVAPYSSFKPTYAYVHLHSFPFGMAVEPVWLSRREGDCASVRPQRLSVSNRYAPDLQRLDQEFSPKGVQFRLVYVEPGLTSAAMEKHRREYGYSMPGVLDADHQFVRRAGVGITPEAAVFVQDDLVYRGRIDDRYMSVGKERPRALHHDLEEVLSGILAGKRLSFRETQAVGCVIEKVE